MVWSGQAQIFCIESISTITSCLESVFYKIWVLVLEQLNRQVGMRFQFAELHELLIECPNVFQAHPSQSCLSIV